MKLPRSGSSIAHVALVTTGAASDLAFNRNLLLNLPSLRCSLTERLRARLRLRLRQKAFTLIEIMMALAIFGLVLSAIYASWTLIIRSSQTSQKVTARIQRERVAMRTVEEALLCARSFQSALDQYSFNAENGDSAALSFVARLPQSFPRSGKFGDFDVRRLTFQIESGPEGGRQLVLRQNPILMELDEDEKNYPLVLARGMEKMNFEFWDTRKQEWIEEWTQTNALPPMVKVVMQFGDPEQFNTSYKYNYSTPRDKIGRIIKLPTITVPTAWQAPNQQGQSPPR